MIGPKNCTLTVQDNEPPTFEDCCSAQLMVDIVLDIATVETVLSKMPCDHHCHSMLPTRKNIEILHQTACDYAEFTFVAYQDNAPAIKTKYGLVFIENQAAAMMEQILQFCYMHCCRQHKLYSIAAIHEHVSQFFEILPTRRCAVFLSA